MISLPPGFPGSTIHQPSLLRRTLDHPGIGQTVGNSAVCNVKKESWLGSSFPFRALRLFRMLQGIREGNAVTAGYTRILMVL